MGNNSDMESMRTFADQLWKYMVPKLDSKFASNVGYFRAKVKTNLGNNTLEVERPLETGTLTLPCTTAMSGATTGQQVTVLVMGSLSNAVVVADGKMDVSKFLYITAGQKEGTTLGTGSTAEGYETTASGGFSHAEGDGTTASGWGCHAEGNNTIANASNQMDFSNPRDPYGSSHAEGFKTTASGEASHAEGSNTKATGMTSHAEGIDTTASGVASHAEGFGTTASGDGGSHAEGHDTTAIGVASHAEGDGTIAYSHQHVFGKYNVAITDQEGEIAEIVGWGTSDTQRKSIRIMDIYGNMTITGTLTQNSDARLKDVAGEIPDVSGIRAVRFKWNDTNGEHDDRDHIGYLAQEVEQIAPYLVGEDSNGYKSLDYIALLTAKV